MPEAEEKKIPPKEIELTELEAMKIAAISATIGKLHAEIQVAELQIEKLRRAIEDRSSDISKLVGERNCVFAEISVEKGIDNISKYDLDLSARRGYLRPQRAGDREDAPRSPAQGTAAPSPDSGSNP